MIIIFIIIVGSIYALYNTNQDDSTSLDSTLSDKWLFAMDTSSASVGGKSAYSTGYIPTLVVIDSNGDIVHRDAGVHSKQELIQYIDSINSGTIESIETAPDFTLNTFNDQEFKLSDYKGKIIILDLMAVRCPPCHNQMPELQGVKEELGNDVVILSIDVDGAYGMETEQDVIDTFEEYILL